MVYLQSTDDSIVIKKAAKIWKNNGSVNETEFQTYGT